MKVITRFAPSPTGYLHIGGARSALFNYHFAKQNNGLFLLRIEDTDKGRHSQEAVSSIIGGLNWLGIKSDKPPVFQSQNAKRHIEVANQLLSEGLAYLCYEKKVTEGDKTEIVKTEQPSIKLKIPKGTTLVKDTVHGEIEFNNQDIGDIVLLRSNQDPTYMLSVVVDDIDMQITHVIRGDDHLSNTPKQMLIYKAMGQNIPSFTHMPLIHGMDGKKLSKRHNAVSVEEYKNMGYLPQALCNYLMLLGWSPKTEDEIFSTEELTQRFKLGDINKSAARFDTERLNYINMQHIKAMQNSALEELIIEIITNNPKAANIQLESQEHIQITEQGRQRIEKVLQECKKQNNLNSAAQLAYLFLPNANIRPEAEAADAIKNNQAIAQELLQMLQNFSTQKQTQTNTSFDDTFKEFLKQKGYKFGTAGPVLRSMLIGKTSSVNIGTIMETLTPEEAIKRAQQAIQQNEV